MRNFCIHKLPFFALLGVLLLPSCAQKTQLPEEESATRIVWPAAPQEAKIAWVKEYKILKETSSRQGFWGRIGDFFLGPNTAHITRSYGVCTDDKNQLFIADTGSSVIHIFDMQTTRYRFIEGNDKVQLSTPIGLVYVEGSLYITDSSQQSILEYDLQEGSLKRLISMNSGRPTGIAFSQYNRLLYVSDTVAHQVVAYSLDGIEQFRFGERGIADGQFNYPTDLWVDITGKVYVTDALNARIQMFSVAGEFLGQFGQPGDTAGYFSKPKGIAVNQHGYIYVCDALFDSVQIFDAAGQLLLTFGDNGTRPGQFWMPSGLFIDSQSYIYVTDTYNQRIQVFKEVNR
ncbi:SMP-30/gluconolactonase/LRE family protein [uncultured Desulfuromusa sp.]|uniref:SMP-30/gluconolactonase/LRE family protein n=1 Tax=uncultured Desulfuromusa sp. TaxID=219183 RepID=UPI002AA9080A|nr:SMP-30/gluconolactonase/LRE family protein [uncultured Desulfuromusa sp.]